MKKFNLNKKCLSSFYKDLQHQLNLIPNKCNVIILGDLNARIGSNSIRNKTKI